MLSFIIIYMVIGVLINVIFAKKSIQDLKGFNIPLRALLSVWITITAPIYLLTGIVIGIILELKH